LVKTGAQWEYLPHDFPPPHLVREQARRWMQRGVFEDLVHDLRMMLRGLGRRNEQPSAAVYDGCTLQSSPESGKRARYDGAKRRKGSTVHMAVDTLGHLLALLVTLPMSRKERKWLNCPKPCKRSRVNRLRSPLWIRATPACKPSRPLPGKASSCG